MVKEIQATLPAIETCNAKNLQGEKEEVDSRVLMAFDAKERKRCQAGTYPQASDGMATVLTARWWMARSGDGASPVYCSVWINTRDGRSFSGHGKAGGYGYCKSSAAFQDALDSAGVELSALSEHYDAETRERTTGPRKRASVAGVGESAVREAAEAIARAAGYGRCPQVWV